MGTNKKKKPLLKIVLFSIGGLIVISLIVFLIWSSNPWTGDENAQTALLGSSRVAVTTTKDGMLVMQPSEPTGECLIFYSGAHTLNTAYAALLNSFANVGYTVFAPRFPLNYAILDSGVAGKIVAQEPLASDCQSWVGVGHSLGAGALSYYVAKNPETFRAVMLLAATPDFFAKDLSNYAGALASVIGSNDGVINEEKWMALRDRLPETAFLVTIPGANHTQYGNYIGFTNEKAEISPVQQQMMTLETLLILTDQYDANLLEASSSAGDVTN